MTDDRERRGSGRQYDNRQGQGRDSRELAPRQQSQAPMRRNVHQIVPDGPRGVLVGEALINALDYWQQQGANILLPTTKVMDLSPYHKPRLEIIKLSPVPEDRDVYFNKVFCENGELALAKNGLLKLARTGGIQFFPAMCGRTDDNKDPRYVCYKVVGGIRLADGSYFFQPGTKEIDLRPGGAEEAKFKRQVKNKLKSWPDDNGRMKAPQFTQAQADEWIEEQLTAALEHKLSNAETKAILRCVRALLQVKPKYKKAELENPFVVLHIDFVPDFDDPDTRKILVAAAAYSQAGLMGDFSGMTGDGAKAERQLALMDGRGPQMDPVPEGRFADEEEDDDEEPEEPDFGDVDESREVRQDEGPTGEEHADLVIDGTSYPTWLKSMRTALTRPDAKATFERAKTFKNDFMVRGLWKEFVDVANAKLDELEKEEREAASRQQ